MNAHPIPPRAAPAIALGWLRGAFLCAVLAGSALLTGCETRGQGGFLGAAMGSRSSYLVGSAAHDNRERSYRNDYHRSRSYHGHSRTYSTASRSYHSYRR